MFNFLLKIPKIAIRTKKLKIFTLFIYKQNLSLKLSLNSRFKNNKKHMFLNGRFVYSTNNLFTSTRKTQISNNFNSY